MVQTTANIKKAQLTPNAAKALTIVSEGLPFAASGTRMSISTQ